MNRRGADEEPWPEVASASDEERGSTAPVHVSGPDGDWERVREQFAEHGRTVVHTTWGEWLTAVLLDPRLRTLLGRDWPRYRQTEAPADRMRFAVSRVVVRHTAAAALEVPATELDLAYRPGGRPYLRGMRGTGVSLSHTDDLIVVGISRDGTIGVDAEPVARQASFELLRDHLCTPGEAARLAALPDAERRLPLLHLWTLKEAYTKALGHGMRRRFSEFGFDRDDTGHIVLDEESDRRRAWEFDTRLVQGRYLVSVAHRPEHPVKARLRGDSRPLEETGRKPADSIRCPKPDNSGVFDGRWGDS